ncbi:ATP-binding protein [Adlercreutzia sp. ZJ141]|uniref:ATP-binding protein n=1 Tax=Adlercreutzia sp. ZJ141 TaxID=2709406 RepID=UPI0013ED2F99|nr:ATP-grasp domain-containing protein [Adlercreutzia sp. ZJ141]
MEGKLLIVGSDFGTYDIALEAKRMGLYVITADYFPTTPTKEVSDEAWLVSTADVDEMERLCRKHGVNGVTYGASDFNMEKSRDLCRRLGLPWYSSNDYSTTVARNKSEFRKICERVGALIAEGMALREHPSQEVLNAITYPVVIKPVDKGANRGMSYCNNEDELLAAYDKALSITDADIVLCERQLHGQEWVANYVMANGEARLLYFGREFHQEGKTANLYSFINTTANGLKQYLEDVNGKVKEVFREAGFENGIAWVETMRDEDGHFYLIEPAYRYSSETSYKLYEKVNGFNTVRWMIETAMGVEHDVSDLPDDLITACKDCVGSYHLFAERNGTVDSIEGIDELTSMENVSFDLPKRPGSEIAQGLNLGLVRIYAPDIDSMIKTLKRINEVFFIKDADDKNLFIRFTGYDELRDDFNTGLRDFDML